MWCLQVLLFTLAFSLCCGTSDLIHVFGYEGREAQVSCHYVKGYESSEKYLCRNNCGSDDVLVTTTEANKDRYSIGDDINRRVFTTTISNLHHRDTGKYWCGVTRNGMDYYPAEVKLEVMKDTCCDNSTKVQCYDGGSASISCAYVSQHQNNLKYICRGNRPSTCLQQAEVTSNSRTKARFSLTDDNVSAFTVNITSVAATDSGSYLCGVHASTGLDVFSAVDLEVREWCCVKSVNLSGTEGRPLTMQCAYPPQHETNRKFLCKGDHHISCTDMTVIQNNSGQTDVRFTLQENVSSSSFLVTISELKAGDAGTYWCGSDSQWSFGNYTKIQLSVDVAPFNIVVFTVPAVLLFVLIFVLVIVCRYKCHKLAGTGANVTATRVADAEEMIGESDVYENQDVVVYSKQRKSKQQGTCPQYAGAGGAHQDSMNKIFYTADGIYCNEFYGNINKR